VESIISAEVSAQTKAWPHKPEGLWAGSLRLQKVPLDWHANNEEDILHYHIYRKESGSNFFTAVSKTGIETHYTDTGLKNGTEYTYQIQAEDKDGLISEASDPVSVRTKPRPQAPQGMSVRYENKKAILSWQANPETDVVSYVIYERFLILVNKVASVPGTEYRINGLSPGSSKTVFITAVDRDGLESEYSTSITITAP
jgi:fibronectin type 3 domain-containing protein